MKNIVYLKKVDSHMDIDSVSKKVTYVGTFKIAYREDLAGLGNIFKGQMKKYLKSITPEFKPEESIIIISRFAKCADSDTFRPKVGERLAKIKVEKEVCRINKKLQQKLFNCMAAVTLELSKQISNSDQKLMNASRSYLKNVVMDLVDD